MLPYEFHPFILLRVPELSYADYNPEDIQTVLDSSAFQKATYFASREFYLQLKVKAFNYSAMPAAMRLSVLNYYSRMCFRSTPFGMFASFAALKWAEDGETLKKVSSSVHVFPDFRLSGDRIKALPGAPDHVRYFPNNSFYKVGQERRYLKWGYHSGDGGIASRRDLSFLNFVLSLCRNGLSSAKLLEAIGELFPGSEHEILDGLVSDEVIFSNLTPNVTGEPYHRRLLRSNASHAELEHSEGGNLDIPDADDIPTAIRTPFYVNTCSEVNGSLDAKIQGTISDGLYALRRLQAAQASDSPIKRFKERFYDRFEDREVPLLLALDPTTGVGYDDLEVMVSQTLLEGIEYGRIGPGDERKLAWTKVSEMLLNKIVEAGTKGIVDLTEDDIRNLDAKNDEQLSPGIPVIFRLSGEDRVFLEHAGGVTATSLAGRFTLFDTRIEEACRDLANREQQMNPQVIFAEVAFFNNEHAANINTRSHIREYEIPVLCHSTLPRERIIDLNDLYLSVNAGELILRSQRLNKRIVPRLSTAYNHRRSDLPVFRFLCDLQHEGLCNLSFKPDSFIPGLKRYPRIQYKGCILKERQWTLDSADVRSLSVATFKDFARSIGLTRYFTFSEGDRQLVFDWNDDSSVDHFLSASRGPQKITLHEFIMPPENALVDSDGKGLIPQFVAFLTATIPTYSGLPSAVRPTERRRSYLPGSEWLYWKIYCHPQMADELLVKRLRPFINALGAGLESWFFVRYNDSHHHLRLRIKCDIKQVGQIFTAMEQVLRSGAASDLIHHVEVSTYRPEWERYSPAMLEAERSFFASSALILAFLRYQPNETALIAFAANSLHEILNRYHFDLAGRIRLLETICTRLINEQGEEKRLRQSLNEKFRTYQRQISTWLEAPFARKELKRLFNAFGSSLDDVYKVISAARGHLDKSAADLAHMHMNRIFTVDQRKRELVIYYLVLRYYLSQKARLRSSGAEDWLKASN